MTPSPDATSPAPEAAPPAPAPARRRPSGRAVATWVSLVAMCGLLLGGMFLPVPYVIEQPGPAIDVLGEHDGERVLSISGAEQYPTTGSLMMTTVSVAGGPGYPVTPAQVIGAWFDSSESVLPRELVFPDGQSEEETSLRNSADMTTSQQDAVAVALTALGMAYHQDVMVAGVLQGGPADGVLEPGDIVVSIDGQSRTTTADYQKLTRAAPAGQDLTMVVRRAGAETTVQVPTEQVDGTTRMGIVLAPGYEFPVDVTVTVDGVGGPSAGTMFALAVYDELTPGSLTGGAAIAGTGTMSADGQVGAIGGIRQKMVGAREEGARFFLAPAGNCDEVTGHVPSGLAVVKVSTFDDALAAVETIGTTGSADSLPTCGS